MSDVKAAVLVVEDEALIPMDGLKLAHFVRDRWPPIRIVVASGMQILAESQLPPGSRFFRKPYDDNSIISALSELLDAAS